MHRFLLFLLLLSLMPFTGAAQAEGTADTLAPTGSTRKLYILPLVTYSPETSIRLGVVGAFLFRPGKASENTLLSSVRAPISYTLNNQARARLSYEIFTDGNKHVFMGSAEWQRFPLFFYGIGPESPPENEELYSSRTFGFEFTYLNNVVGGLFIGGRLRWLNSKTLEREEGGLLSQDGLITGADGGIVAGIGLTARYDRRDNNFNPSAGPFIETSVTTAQRFLGGDFTYTRWDVDLRHYLRPFGRHVLALQLFTVYNWGDPPFEQLALLGGDEVMRGHYLGRFRDKMYWTLQAEYRLPVGRRDWFGEDEPLSFWRRWGLVGFAGIGTVAPTLSDFGDSSLKYSLGVGIRYLLLPEERVNVRIDFGFGTQTPGFYLNVREAF